MLSANEEDKGSNAAPSEDKLLRPFLTNLEWKWKMDNKVSTAETYFQMH